MDYDPAGHASGIPPSPRDPLAGSRMRRYRIPSGGANRVRFEGFSGGGPTLSPRSTGSPNFGKLNLPALPQSANEICLGRQIWHFLKMPTVLRVGPYQFYFYSHEDAEPPHVHVDRENRSAKIWLQPVSLAKNARFRPVELRKIIRIVAKNRKYLLSSWHGHFGNQRG
jgi:hypothetical protein